MKAASRSVRTAIAAYVVAVTPGCAGARLNISATSSLYPMSFSHLVRDRTGRLYDGGSMDRVGTFSASKTSFAILYSALGVFPRYDVSDDVNRQVSSARGEAIIDTTVSVTTDCNILNGFPILNIVPLWPGCVHVVISGAIVRRRPSRAGRLIPEQLWPDEVNPAIVDGQR